MTKAKEKKNHDTVSEIQYRKASHMELSKLLTRPGVSPEVGWWKQGLLTLQMMPWTHASVPAEGRALLGKWPEMEKKISNI